MIAPVEEGNMSKVFIVGTFDTKAEELLYARDIVEAAGAEPLLVDVGTTGSHAGADISSFEVARFHPSGQGAVFEAGDRGKAIGAMAEALTAFLLSRNDIGAVLGMGGTGNTALVSQAMRALPIGLPKLLVSTVASGNVAPYVGASDITMMYSVVDIAGLNKISRRVIANAADASAGMTNGRILPDGGERSSVGLTMFGLTTPCVTALRKKVDATHDTFVFHATGTGGQSMEKLVDSELLDTVIDVTTTEVADMLYGGVFPATSDRFGSIIRRQVPYVGSVGAVDMVNFGAVETVPEQYRSRKLHIHNSQVTLMRTTADENQQIGVWIADRLNQMNGPVRFVLPLLGVSGLDAVGMPFHAPDADAALFEAIRGRFKPTENRRLIEVNAHINDETFAAALAAEFYEIQNRK